MPFVLDMQSKILLPNPATAPATRPAQASPNFRVRFCTWCKQVDLRGERRETDAIIITVVGKRILASWNGHDLIVQDGICERCAVLWSEGKVIDGSTSL